MAGAETKTRPAFAGLRFLVGALAACAPADAFAGAWIAPKDGQEIWTSVAGKRDGLSYYETSGYLEAPLSERTSVVIVPWVEQAGADENGWRAEATLAAKHVVVRSDHGVVAVQAGALWVSEPPAHCQEGGGEVRVLGGYNVRPDVFVNVEAAERGLSGGCTDQRVDLTIGVRAGPHWLGLAQVFVDGARYGDETVKAQLSLVHFGSAGRGVQVGVRARVDEGDAEPALVLAFWSEPGRRRRG